MDTNPAARRKAKKLPDIDDSVWNLKTITVLIVVIACLTLFIFGVSKLRAARVAALPQEFEGRIVDKWAGYDSTDEGAYPYFRLVVDVGGSRLIVPVNKEIYEEAQVGLRLKRSAKGLEVIRGPMNSTTAR